MGEEDVRRLEVAVDDAERVSMREPLKRLEHVIDCVADRELLLEPEELLEIASVEPLHHHVGQAVHERADVHDARDVRAVDARRETRFGQKPLHHLREPREVWRKDLHRARLVEQHVMRTEDDRHPALSEQAVDSILVRENVPHVRQRW
jgi:hypothetical protein